MRYFGGKIRLGKKLSTHINLLKPESYHEPFCGMFGVGRHIVATQRSGSDACPDTIEVLKAVQSGWEPPRNVSKEQYRLLKASAPSALRGFVGFGCSFGGKFFGGYASTAGRNYAENAANALTKLRPLIQGVEFCWKDYTDYFPTGPHTVVYCDPPYAGTTGYSVGKFDSAKFWDWAFDISNMAIVLVSEYHAPEGFVEVWSEKVRTDMNGRDGKLSRTECLFRASTLI
jgi:DNA adenine methylase